MDKVDATLRLSGSGSILVTVQTAAAEPIDDVKVSAKVALDPSAADASTATANASPSLAAGDAAPPGGGPLGPRVMNGVSLGNGHFRIGPLTKGRYQVLVADGVNPPVRPDRAPDGVVEVTGRAIVETTVTLSRGQRIRGRVVDGAHQPMPDVWVSATCRPESAPGDDSKTPAVGSTKRVMSDPEGRFVLGGLEARTLCTVRAEQPYGSVGLQGDVHPGDEVAVTLPDLGTLRGTAVMANGRTVDQFTLSVQERDTGRARNESVTATGGNWTMAKVVPGRLENLGARRGGELCDAVAATGVGTDARRRSPRVSRTTGGRAAADAAARDPVGLRSNLDARMRRTSGASQGIM